MRGLLVLIAVVGCKGGDKPESSGGAPASSGAPAAAGPCKPMSGVCTRMPAAELGKLFEAPSLAGSGADHDDAPMGPMDECTYTQEDEQAGVKLLLRYQCWGNGAADNYKGTKGAVAGAGGIMEDLAGLGDEAYWYHAGSKSFIQGHIKARRGAVIFDIAIDSYRLGQKQVDPAVAKQRALDTAKRFLAAAP